MREIVFDTETTGLSYSAGHRLVEIGCVELINRVPTGRHFHRYLCPDRDMPVERIVDTLQIARAKHPGAKHTLDALCVRYGVDLSARELHGALLDAQLLAQVFIELTGGRQIALGLAVGETTGPDRITVASAKSNIRPARIFAPSAEELARHSAFMAGFEDPLWGVPAAG